MRSRAACRAGHSASTPSTARAAGTRITQQGAGEGPDVDERQGVGQLVPHLAADQDAERDADEQRDHADDGGLPRDAGGRLPGRQAEGAQHRQIVGRDPAGEQGVGDGTDRQEEKEAGEEQRQAAHGAEVGDVGRRPGVAIHSPLADRSLATASAEAPLRSRIRPSSTRSPVQHTVPVTESSPFGVSQAPSSKEL